MADPRRGEPVTADARLGGEMTVRSDHGSHDHELIASLLDPDLGDAGRARAEELLASCDDCALLHDDLVALSAATRALPVPSRSRDFSLTPADARRLRARGWRRLIAAIGSSRDVFSRPLAVGLTTLGLAGLLVVTIPGALGGVASAPESLSTVSDASGAVANPESVSINQASPAASTEPGSAAAVAPPAAALPVPSAESGPEAGTSDQFAGSGESGSALGDASKRVAYDPTGDDSIVSEPIGRPLLLLVTGLLLVAGVGLFVLRWAARRLGDG